MLYLGNNGNLDPSVVPTVVRGREMLPYFTVADSSKVGVEPCSLNVVIDRLTKDGKTVLFPFTLEPEEEIVGHTAITFRGQPPDVEKVPEAVLCVETRSRRAARWGLTCMGFFSGNGGRAQAFLEDEADIAVVLKNYNPTPVTVHNPKKKPFSPIQLLLLRDELLANVQNNGVHLKYNGEDVTEERRIAIGNMTGYVVHLGNEALYFEGKEKPILIGEKMHHYIKISPGKLSQVDPPFWLGITAEEVITNGQPVYMLPFHCLDVLGREDELLSRESIARLFYETFNGTTAMPVTANAGVHNPGCNGKIIFENICRGRDLERYLEKGKPFGIVVPIPFCDGIPDNTTYRTQRRQRGITLD